jgi:hypothetical protein
MNLYIYLVNKANFAHNLFLVYLLFYLFFIAPCIPHSHPHRMTSTKCHIDTVVSPDDGHIVARNMKRFINVLRINILRINCAQSWLYLHDRYINSFYYYHHSPLHVSAN